MSLYRGFSPRTNSIPEFIPRGVQTDMYEPLAFMTVVFNGFLQLFINSVGFDNVAHTTPPAIGLKKSITISHIANQFCKISYSEDVAQSYIFDYFHIVFNKDCSTAAERQIDYRFHEIEGWINLTLFKPLRYFNLALAYMALFIVIYTLFFHLANGFKRQRKNVLLKIDSSKASTDDLRSKAQIGVLKEHPSQRNSLGHRSRTLVNRTSFKKRSMLLMISQHEFPVIGDDTPVYFITAAMRNIAAPINHLIHHLIRIQLTLVDLRKDIFFFEQRGSQVAYKLGHSPLPRLFFLIYNAHAQFCSGEINKENITKAARLVDCVSRCEGDLSRPPPIEHSLFSLSYEPVSSCFVGVDFDLASRKWKKVFKHYFRITPHEFLAEFKQLKDLEKCNGQCKTTNAKREIRRDLIELYNRWIEIACHCYHFYQEIEVYQKEIIVAHTTIKNVYQQYLKVISEVLKDRDDKPEAYVLNNVCEWLHINDPYGALQEVFNQEFNFLVHEIVRPPQPRE